MEMSLESQDDSSGAALSVKSEDGSPNTEDPRGSPPPNCAICLGRCRNKSFTDSCLHQFCFKCLVTWSKVKSECPLCKQTFKSIIYNVRPNQQYEEYRVEETQVEEDRIDIDDLMTATRRFRYRTTLTFPRGRETLALQQLLMHYPLSAMVGELPSVAPAPLPSLRRRRSPGSFRRTVYRHNLWARPLPDFTGRFRDCSPEFYRFNASQAHRLVPWLNRELHYLLLENAGHIAYVLARVLELLPQYHIMSTEFRDQLYRFLGVRTDHFLHELHCFASTPYDITGYDRNVQYTTGDARLPHADEHVISSSDTDSGDTVVLVSSPPSPPLNLNAAAPAAAAGPSAPSAPVYPRGHIAPRSGVIPIETISHSDTDDDEVVVTGYIKPPQSRTPEVVDLLASDSDVVVQECPPAEAGAAARGSLVQLTLSRAHRARAVLPASPASSDSDLPSYTPPPAQAPPRRRFRRRRFRSSTSSWSDSASSGESARKPRPPSPSPSPDRSSLDTETASTTSKCDRSARRKKTKRNKRSGSDRHTSDAAESRSSVTTSVSESASASVPELPMSPVPGPSHASSSDIYRVPPRDRRENDKRSKQKSRNGKGVKSSRRHGREASPPSHAPAEPRPGPSGLASYKRKHDGEVPGPSGTSGRSKKRYRNAEDSPPSGNYKKSGYDGNPGPSGSSDAKKKCEENPILSESFGSFTRRCERERNRSLIKRLRSVVKRASDAARGPSSSSRSSGSPAPPAARAARPARPLSDSDDDIPLNLTVKRPA